MGKIVPLEHSPTKPVIYKKHWQSASIFPVSIQLEDGNEILLSVTLLVQMVEFHVMELKVSTLLMTREDVNLKWHEGIST